MSLNSAMFSGVSGMTVNSDAMSVIGNNLANSSTIGFKGARTTFSDVLSSTVFGSGGPSQIGRGTGLAAVDNIFSQGTFESTASDTDVAIEGEGFFLMKEPGSDETFYSRAGAFSFDDSGFLVNPSGYQVQGRSFTAEGALEPGDPGSIQVVNEGLIPSKVTEEVVITTNFDANSPIVDVAANPFDPADDESYNFATAVTAFDTLGNQHLVTVYTRKQDPAAGGADNTWDWFWNSTDDAGNQLSEGGIDPPPISGEIAFETDGSLSLLPAGNGAGAVAAADIDWGNGSAPTGIAFDFATTQFNNDSTVVSVNQNGYAAGTLTNIGINGEGTVVASYSNGEQQQVATLSLAKFTNPMGLTQAGSNMFLESGESGAPRIGLPGPELGSIMTNSLEQSTVDMGQEFIKMITTQRAYQANSKIITTVDELLGDTINLKR